MSKILLTGMTASQSSISSNSKNLQFAGVLYKVLTEIGHEIVWGDPDLSLNKESLDLYDSVIVGVSPISSLGANRVYGALNIIEILWGSDKLSLFVDAPSTYQIMASLKTVNSNPTSLLKEFYSYRKGYKDVLSNIALSSNISNAVLRLFTEKWPTTLYPKLPWKPDSVVTSMSPENMYSSFIGFNFDSVLLSNVEFAESNRNKWVVDSYSHKDTEKLVKTLSIPTSPMKWNKGVTDDQVLDQMSRSIGAIVSTHRGDGSWWSYRYAQAFTSKTPVYTDWKETGILDESWNVLASTIENMTDSERLLLSERQKNSYFKNLEDIQTEINKLESILKISRRNNG